MFAASGPADRVRIWSGDLCWNAWERLSRVATLGPNRARARRFGAFGEGSAVCFPIAALFNEQYIRIGARTIIGPYCSLSAGIAPGHVPLRDPVVTIGDRTVIGKGSGIVGHVQVDIGDDVWTGHYVYITDANHGYEDVNAPIGLQFAGPKPVSIGNGSWLGHGAIVLAGSTIGEHVVIGAGAVVTGDIPDRCVAVGNPARVIRRYVDGEGWVRVPHGGAR